MVTAHFALTRVLRTLPAAVVAGALRLHADGASGARWAEAIAQVFGLDAVQVSATLAFPRLSWCVNVHVQCSGF